MHVFLSYSYYVRHEGLLSRFYEVRREIWDVHIAPLQGHYHFHQGLYDQGSQILIIGSENDLFFLKDSRKNDPQSVWRKG